jgi:hypothetical protein
MPVGIECNRDAGVAHLVANVGGGFALRDQLAGRIAQAVSRGVKEGRQGGAKGNS